MNGFQLGPTLQNSMPVDFVIWPFDKILIKLTSEVGYLNSTYKYMYDFRKEEMLYYMNLYCLNYLTTQLLSI